MPSCRVLLCDDDPGFRALVRHILKGSEWVDVVGEAEDGAEALELAVALRPDVILLDLDMPGMDGRTALPLLRAEVPRARVIVLTGTVTGNAVVDARRLGAHGLVWKGSDLFELAGILSGQPVS